MADQIVQWLEGLGLGQYAKVFAENDIDIQNLFLLTDDDLKDLGLSLGHRRTLQAALRGEPTGVTKSAADSRQSPTPADAERRQLTVLFCDLVGSTALSAELDPEDMREVLRAYQDASAGMIARYDGYVAKFMGDGVYAYFGWPRAHEDDAERAINAGLDIVAAVEGLGRDLHVRIGIATGTVAVGDIVGEGAAEEANVVGEAPNLAGRLQELAKPDTVVIGESTHALAGGLFECTDLGQHALKGIADPVSAWVVDRPRRIDSRFTAMRAERLTELLGRDEELEILMRRWERAKAGEGQAVLISGEPGIGKSRLVHAFRSAIADEPHAPVAIQCSPHHVNSAIHPILENIERRMSLLPSDSPEQRLDKLEAWVAEGQQVAADIAPLIGPLLGIDVASRYAPLHVPPQRQKEILFEALNDRLTRLAAVLPCLIAVEDAHWIDPTSLEFLSLHIERARDTAALAVVTYRPEFEAPWVGDPQTTLIALNRLTRGESAALARRVDGGADLPAETIDRIAARADGIPLFVEELTKTVLESAEGIAAKSAIEVPATLQDSLEARLDRLGDAKEIAQIGAVIGRSFRYDLLARVSDRSRVELDNALDHLVRSELAFRLGDPPEATYTFKHALVQDTAYGTLLRSKRAELHARIAGTIESSYPEKIESEPEVLAHHFSNSGNLIKGAEYWLKAGQIALQQSSFQEAVAQLDNGMRLVEQLPNEPKRFRLESELRATLAPAIRAYKGLGHPETEQAFKLAYELCRQDPESNHTFPLLWGLWHIGFSQGHMKPAFEYADELLGLAEGSRNTESLLIAHCSVAMISYFTAKNHRAIDHVEHSLALYDPEVHAALAFSYFFEFGVFGHIILAMTRNSIGLPDLALQAADKAVAIARPMNQLHTLQFALSTRGLLLSLRGDGDAVLRNAEEGASLAVAPAAGLVNEICRGWAMARTRQWDEGLRRMRESIQTWKQIGSEYMLPLFGVLLAESCIACGRLDEASSIADEELSRIDSGGQEQWRSPILSIKADTLVRRSIPGEAAAEENYRRAIKIARSQSAKSWELRAASHLARLWHSQGKTTESRDLLAPIYGWFSEGLDTADLKEAKALLDELS